jgi:AcrR family transcriptional regulator
MTTNAPKRGRDGAAKRKLILDATEKLMREEGYAAVSSRRVAELAGLTSPLVHYHFGTMDDLFLALFRRSEEEFLQRQMDALTSDNPVTALWRLSIEPDSDLVSEFIALAVHRETVRDEIARSNDRSRAIQTPVLAKALRGAGVDTKELPAEVLAFLIAAVSRTLVTEGALGASLGHDAVRAYIEKRIALIRPKTDETVIRLEQSLK